MLDYEATSEYYNVSEQYKEKFMKKLVLLVTAFTGLWGVANTHAQEVTYVEDCSQGLLINRMQDNWFITLQGGPGFLNSNYDTEATFKDRIGAQIGVFGGKWFTPVFGFRLGASAMIARGATTEDGIFRHHGYAPIDEQGRYYPERFMAAGPEIDLMLNITNWWCGYRPDRVYSAIAHVGGGGYWTIQREDSKWINAHNRTLFANIGLTNNFSVSKRVDLFVDVQYTLMDYSTLDRAYGSLGPKDMSGHLSAQVGFTYNFGKTDWNCPVAAVCPTYKYTDAEGDALVARLASADSKINDLQRQLDDCLNRPVEVIECEQPLATIYYPINVSTLSARERTLVQSLAEVMKANPDKRYVITGWADNYTGNDEINTRLRQERAESVKKCLLKAGVPESQIESRIDAGNLTDYGIKGAHFDRAVTIVEAK